MISGSLLGDLGLFGGRYRALFGGCYRALFGKVRQRLSDTRAIMQEAGANHEAPDPWGGSDGGISQLPPAPDPWKVNSRGKIYIVYRS